MLPPVSSVSSVHSVTGASAPMPPAKRMNDLFSRIDTAGAGSINQVQLTSAFSTQNPPLNFRAYGADRTWSALDPKGTGAVSRADFVTTMTGLMTSLRGYAAGKGNAP